MKDKGSQQEILERIRQAIISYDDLKCPDLCRAALDMGLSANDIVLRGMAVGMEHAGELFRAAPVFRAGTAALLRRFLCRAESAASLYGGR